MCHCGVQPVAQQTGFQDYLEGFLLARDGDRGLKLMVGGEVHNANERILAVKNNLIVVTDLLDELYSPLE